MTRSRALGGFAAVLLVCAALNAALTFHNAWPSVWIEPGSGLSVELCVLVAGMAYALGRRSALGRPAIWIVTAILFALIVGRYLAVTSHALFGRDINLYFDLPHLPDVVAMNAAALSRAELAGAALLTAALLAGLLVALRFGVGVLARSLTEPSVRRGALSLAMAGILVYGAASIPGLRWTERAFAHPVSPVYAEQAAFVAEALSGADDLFLPQATAPQFDPAGLAGADVFVIFLESYGEVAYRVPEIADAVRPRADRAENALRAEGWHMASGFFTSPTFGGASWLAHASFLTGTPVTNKRDYQLLLSSDRDSLVGGFGGAGYRTVALMPGLKLAWPEGRFYRYDAVYDAAGLAYDGPPFGWWAIPDQFTLGRFLARETIRENRDPLFMVFPTVMSHMPFASVPPYVRDWRQATQTASYASGGPHGRAAFGAAPTARGAYRAAILYNLDMVEGFLSDAAPSDALVIVLGDHQPPGIVSGPGAGKRVPVHVFSRNAKRLMQFRAAGLRDGFAPAGPSLGDFGALHGIFTDSVR